MESPHDETPVDETVVAPQATDTKLEGETVRADAREFQRRNTQEADNTTERRKGRSTVNVRTSAPVTRPDTNVFGDLRHRKDQKVVGMKDGLRAFLDRSASITSAKNRQRAGSHDLRRSQKHQGKRGTIEQHEDFVRSNQETRPLFLMINGNIAALKVMAFYLITLDTILACALSVGLTCYWYLYGDDREGWTGGGMDWVILGFAVVTPMSASITIAFRRREEALLDIAKIRSFSYQLYLAHCLWDWDKDGGRAGCSNIDWLDHTDSVLAQLVGIGDELSRFLSLPTASRSRHRMTRAGRKEAARTVEVAYRLFDSLYTRRVTHLSVYAERLKSAGLPSSEISRIRQYERFIGESIEHLRMVKMYRSPQALRSFARIFTLLLPPFYAPTYAQIALDLNSLGVGIAFAIITAIGLTALFESIQVLEDPFVAFLTLDGIDVREEFEVLHWQQLVNTRGILFPNAFQFPERGRAALDSVADESVRKLLHKRQFSHESPMSSGGPDEKDQYGMYDSLAAFEKEKEAVVDIELGVPLEPILSQRNRTSSYAILNTMVDAPPSVSGSISGSERKGRRILHTTG